MRFRAFLFFILISAATVGPVLGAVRPSPLPNPSEVVATLAKQGALIQESRLLALNSGRNLFLLAGQGIDPDSLTVRLLDHKGSVIVSDIVFPSDTEDIAIAVEAASYGSERLAVEYFLADLTSADEYRFFSDGAGWFLEQTAVVRNATPRSFPDLTLQRDGQTIYKGALKAGEILRLPVQNPVAVKLDRVFLIESNKLPADGTPFDGPFTVVYRLINDQAHGLGNQTLPPGKIRFYHRGDGPPLFLGEALTPAVPVEGKVSFPLQTSGGLKVVQRLMADDPFDLKRNRDGGLILMSRRRSITLQIENQTPAEIQAEVVIRSDGYWEIEGETSEYRRENSSTAVFPFVLTPKGGGASSQAGLNFTYVRRNIQQREPEIQ